MLRDLLTPDLLTATSSSETPLGPSPGKPHAGI
jgi:hypothetical protein